MQRGTITYPEVVGVRLSAGHAEQLRRLAAADDRPPSALARRLLVRALEAETPGTEKAVAETAT